MITALTVSAVLLTGCTEELAQSSVNSEVGSSLSLADDSSINNSTNNNPNNYDANALDVLVAAINTPDLQSGTDFYRNPISIALISDPVVGFNNGTEELYSRSIPFNQVETDEPIQVQRVVASNYEEGRYDQFVIIPM